MHRLIITGLMAGVVSGCTPWSNYSCPPGHGNPPAETWSYYYENPALVPPGDPQDVWETVADVVDDYFDIDGEEPVRLVGQTLTEGRLTTYPRVAATILEPWHSDSVGTAERIENTLQSMRRQATLRVIPSERGYRIDVVVYKELEVLERPEHATAGGATFRYDGLLTRVVNPIGDRELTTGWVNQGRDTALEQRIIAQLHSRLGTR